MKTQLDLKSIFQKFSGQKILIVGDVMVDAYLWGRTDRISPEAPVPIVAIDKKDERPGGAANVALNIKELGATPLLCSVIGNDDGGKSLLRILKKNKIKTDGLIASSKRITTVKTRVLSKNHQLIRYDSELTKYLNETDENLFISKVKSIITNEKPIAVIFEDYNKGVLTAEGIKKIISICRSKNIFIAVDPKHKNFFAYKNANLFKPNLREIKDALKKEVEDVNLTILTAIDKKLKKLIRHQISLITLSEHGMFYRSNNETAIIPAHKRNVSDVSGAGDTVISVATLCLACGVSLQESIALSNVAGGLVCQHPGVVPVSIAMLKSEINK